MIDPDETLSAIDAALEAWTGDDDAVSDDAMRWAPEEPEQTSLGAEPTLTIVDELHHFFRADVDRLNEALGNARVSVAPRGTMCTNATPNGEWTQVGWTAASSFAADGDDREFTPQSWGATQPLAVSVPVRHTEVFVQFAEEMRRQHERMVADIRRFGGAFAKVTARWHANLAPMTFGHEYRRHRRRCRACNPAGNPRPLKVNGADYARRRKNRRRRR